MYVYLNIHNIDAVMYDIKYTKSDTSELLLRGTSCCLE